VKFQPISIFKHFFKEHTFLIRAKLLWKKGVQALNIHKENVKSKDAFYIYTLYIFNFASRYKKRNLLHELFWILDIATVLLFIYWIYKVLYIAYRVHSALCIRLRQFQQKPLCNCRINYSNIIILYTFIKILDSQSPRFKKFGKIRFRSKLPLGLIYGLGLSD